MFELTTNRPNTVAIAAGIIVRFGMARIMPTQSGMGTTTVSSTVVLNALALTSW